MGYYGLCMWPKSIFTKKVFKRRKIRRKYEKIFIMEAKGSEIQERRRGHQHSQEEHSIKLLVNYLRTNLIAFCILKQNFKE